jgi:hypothetical protein
MRTNIFHKSKSVAAVPAGTAVTAVTNGSTVDLHQGVAGDYRTALFVVQAGTITDGTHVVTLEHSDNGSVWEAAPDLGTASFASTDDNAVKDLGYDGAKRYVRCVITATGATTGGVFGATAVLYDSAGHQR